MAYIQIKLNGFFFFLMRIAWWKESTSKEKSEVYKSALSSSKSVTIQTACIWHRLGLEIKKKKQNKNQSLDTTWF